MYKKIMVAVDGSDASKLALDAALELARMHKAELRAVYVLDTPRFFYAAGHYDPILLKNSMAEEGRLVLGEAAELMQAKGVTGDIESMEVGTVGDDIAHCLEHAANTWKADIVVLGTHGRRGFQRMLLGSVAERFLRITSRSALLVREPVAV